MARAKYVVTDSAKADMREIIAYLRARSPRAAKTVRLKLYENIRRLGDFPGIGHLREDATREKLRFWSVYSYLIVYRFDRQPIEIIRVFHGARDLPQFFE